MFFIVFKLFFSFKERKIQAKFCEAVAFMLPPSTFILKCWESNNMLNTGVQILEDWPVLGVSIYSSA